MTALLTLAMGQLGDAGGLVLREDPPALEVREPRPREVAARALARCEAVLRRELGSPECTQATVTAGLRELGGSALPAAWQLLWDPQEGSELFVSLARADLTGRSLLRDLFWQSRRSRVTQFFSDLGFSGLSSEEFLWALEYLAEQGGADEVRLSLVLGALQVQAGQLEASFVRAQVVATLRSILSHDEQAYSALRSEVVAAPKLHGPIALTTLTGLSGRRALGVLGDMLDGRLVEGRAGAAAIEEVGRRSLPPFDGYLLGSLRELVRSGEPAARAAGLRALGALDDEESIDLFIANLQADVPGVRSASNAALEEISGLRFGTDARRWTAWHAGELRWWQESAPRTLERLGSDSKAETLAALSEIVTHRLDRSTLAIHVKQLLHHESSDVRRLACVSLGQLGSPVIARELVERLEDIDPSVGESAHGALQSLLNQTLPLDARAWESYLDEGSATLR